MYSPLRRASRSA